MITCRKSFPTLATYGNFTCYFHAEIWAAGSGKDVQGHKDDLILTSWFHRLSIYHKKSLWRFTNRSNQARVTLLSHVPGKQPSLHPSPVIAWNHHNSVKTHWFIPSFKQIQFCLEMPAQSKPADSKAKWRCAVLSPGMAGMSEGGRAAAGDHFYTERERCIC